MKVVVTVFSIVAVAFARADTYWSPVQYLPIPQQGYSYASPQFTDFNEGIHGQKDELSGNSQVETMKHLYFYAAPEEPEYTHLRIQAAPKSQKNTKIIFIKAPHYNGIIPEVIAPPSLAQDQTLIYVLSKKPESQSITIPSAVGTQQAKPEVFFIKYNNKQDAEAQINEGLKNQEVSENVLDFENGDQFVRVLNSNQLDGSISYNSPLILALQSHSESESPHEPVNISGLY